MPDIIDPQHVDSARLKEINLELGKLAHRHQACRLNTSLFSALGAVILALSTLGLIHLLAANESDWAQNPDSPVYALAAQHEHGSLLEAILVTGGFFAGLGLLYKARSQCSRQRRLWQREGDLRVEMRRLRDRLYATDRVRSQGQHPHRAHDHTAPLDPDAARSAYIGIYTPPASHHEQGRA